jgi:hypothetical protein
VRGTPSKIEGKEVDEVEEEKEEEFGEEGETQDPGSESEPGAPAPATGAPGVTRLARSCFFICSQLRRTSAAVLACLLPKT